ncbi:hypothetical protein PENTCL1PPCAC_28995, partial [Pristionchus entomophagus]
QSRTCLICKAQITQLHLGIDACRACAVFYRRARRSKRVSQCKSKTGKCVEDSRVLECRRCRFDLMQGIFERANLDPYILISIDKSEPESSSGLNAESPKSVSSHEPASTHPHIPMISIRYSLILLCANSDPSSSSTPLLDRIRCGYNVMTRIRRTTELCMRPVDQFVHPNAIDDNTFPIIPGTHGSIFRTKQILISSLFDFASISFPEFENLTSNEKWHFVSGCNDLFNVIESNFRAQKIFPDDDRIFLSYTTTLSTDSIDVFLSDHTEKTNIEEATTAIRKGLETHARCEKQAMRRVSPTDEEFLVLLALSFWNTESPSGDEHLSLIASTSRAAIMKDLHSYYSNIGVSDYATRIGQLFCLMVASEKVTMSILEDLELLRLMDINQQPRF